MSQAKNLSIIEHILEFCLKIKAVHKEYGQDHSKYKTSVAYESAISFCLLQIGELAGRLSDEYRDIHREIPWQQIRALRNRIVHGYGSTNLSTIWRTSVDDINALAEFCKTEAGGSLSANNEE